jgi:transcriptional regulator with XRE-family HTH domain
MMARTPPTAEAPLTETLPMLMRERGISYRALATRTRLLDGSGNGLSHSHLVNLAAGRELPSRRVLALLASAFQLSAARMSATSVKSADRSRNNRVASVCRSA